MLALNMSVGYITVLYVVIINTFKCIHRDTRGHIMYARTHARKCTFPSFSCPTQPSDTLLLFKAYSLSTAILLCPSNYNSYATHNVYLRHVWPMPISPLWVTQWQWSGVLRGTLDLVRVFMYVLYSCRARHCHQAGNQISNR